VKLAQYPTRADLVKRAANLVPLLQENALGQEENRRLNEEVVAAMAEAGFFKMRVPIRYGGYESDTGTMREVAAELARGDGAAAWTAAVWWIPTWMAGLFSDQVQSEVFSTPDVRVCGTLSPGGMATPADGGFSVTGKWGFISGAWHSQWQEIIFIAPLGEVMQPVMALVPMAELEIIDDWHTSGLRGSGSVTTVAREVFVPSERTLPLGAVLQQQYASSANASSAMYSAPMLPVACASSVGTMLGLATAARDAFGERLPSRKITYTNYDKQGDAPLTHLRVAEADMLIEEARFQASRLTDLVDSKSVVAQPWTIAERVLARACLGRACQLGRSAIDLLSSASGGSSIYRDVPIQRIARDAQAITMHALIHPDTNAELYGRVSCGLEPNSLYI
jgi:alkylation response protein AidB-like acyl-CoA dehydrogenase